MAFVEWVTHFPNADDNLPNDQPDLLNDPTAIPPPPGLGDATRVSQIHTLRDKLDALALIVGNNTEPPNSLRQRITALENAASSETLQHAYNTGSGALPTIKLDPTRKGILIWDADTSIGATEPLFGVSGPSGTASWLQVLGSGRVALGTDPLVAPGTKNSNELSWLGHDYHNGADYAHLWSAYINVASATPINSEWRLQITYGTNPAETVFATGLRDTDPKGYIQTPFHDSIFGPPGAATGNSGFNLYIRSGEKGTGGTTHGALYLGDSKTSSVHLGAAGVPTSFWDGSSTPVELSFGGITDGYLLKRSGTSIIGLSPTATGISHSGLDAVSLSHDDHLQYALLAGRTGGQTLIGGSAATDALILKSTSAAGTTDYISLCVGTNGGTEGLRVIHDGKVGIGGVSAPSQALDLAGSLNLQSTTSSTTGVVYKGGAPFIHDYKPPANNGYNLFVGVNAGNFTMGSANSLEASCNVGIGANAFRANTTGYNNVAIGYNAFQANTVGNYNTGIGTKALQANTEGFANTSIGHSSLLANTTGVWNVGVGASASENNTTGSYNTSIGTRALQANTTGNYNTSIGNSSLYNNSTGSGLVAVGYQAGYYETGSHKLYIANSNTTTPLIYGDFAAGKLTFHTLGTAKANIDGLALTNLYNAADMDGTATSLLFRQYYYDATTPAAADAARITVGAETDWTAAASTQNAYMAFSTTLGGTVTERIRIAASGRINIGPPNGYMWTYGNATLVVNNGRTAWPAMSIEPGDDGYNSSGIICASGIRTETVYNINAGDFVAINGRNTGTLPQMVGLANACSWDRAASCTTAVATLCYIRGSYGGGYSTGNVTRGYLMALSAVTQAGTPIVQTPISSSITGAVGNVIGLYGLYIGDVDNRTDPIPPTGNYAIYVAGGTSLFGSAILAAQGTQDSSPLVWQGHYFPSGGANHTVDWRAFNDVTSDVNGASAWTLQSRIDSETFATRLTVNSTGLLTLNPGTTPSTALLLDIAGPGTTSTSRNSHSLKLTGRAQDAYNATYSANWTTFVDLSGDINHQGFSKFVWQTWINTGTPFTAMSLDNWGQLTLNAGTYPTTTLHLSAPDVATVGNPTINSHAVQFDSCAYSNWGSGATAHTLDWTAFAAVPSATPINSMWTLQLSFDGGTAQTMFGVGLCDSSPKGLIIGPNQDTLLRPGDRTGAGEAGRDMYITAGKPGSGGAFGTVYLAEQSALTTVLGTFALPHISAGAGNFPVKWSSGSSPVGMITYDTSDARQKRILDESPDWLAVVRRLKPRTYMRRDGKFINGAFVPSSEEYREVGFIAQEVGAVYTDGAFCPADEMNNLWGIKDRALLAATVGAVQSVDDEVTQLKRRVAELEAEVAALRATT